MTNRDLRDELRRGNVPKTLENINHRGALVATKKRAPTQPIHLYFARHAVAHIVGLDPFLTIRRALENR